MLLLLQPDIIGIYIYAIFLPKYYTIAQITVYTFEASKAIDGPFINANSKY